MKQQWSNRSISSEKVEYTQNNNGNIIEVTYGMVIKVNHTNDVTAQSGPWKLFFCYLWWLLPRKQGKHERVAQVGLHCSVPVKWKIRLVVFCRHLLVEGFSVEELWFLGSTSSTGLIEVQVHCPTCLCRICVHPHPIASKLSIARWPTMSQNYVFIEFKLIEKLEMRRNLIFHKQSI